MKTLRLILGDQLNINHSWFEQNNSDVIYCMMEMKQETQHVKLHIQKILGFLAAMRDFGKQVEDQGHEVIYLKINDGKNMQELPANLNALIKEYNIEKFEYMMPDAYRLDEQLQSFCDMISIETERYDTEHFYTERDELSEFFDGKKQFLMESFYRYMRKKHDILMKGESPEGGDWNYDKSNRNKYDSKHPIPDVMVFDNDVDDIRTELQEMEVESFGRLDGTTLRYPINRKQALEQLEYFCEYLLVHFGDYQDAMTTEDPYLFHSCLSFAMNVKLISPSEVVDRVIEEFRKRPDEIDITQVEGFVRQILGWREYMRGMYWMEMPDYKKLNKLNNKNKLPQAFWDGETKMKCMKEAVDNSLDNAYAHHIQRLMVLGNFSLLMQTDPDEIDAWFLGVYADAVEWVQLPNTRGMSQYADGGMIATKPYISSANYINKMGDYCKNCSYDHKDKTGENACPMNALYWNFLDDKREELKDNRRMGMMYHLLSKMSSEELHDIKKRAQHIMENPNEY